MRYNNHIHSRNSTQTLWLIYLHTYFNSPGAEAGMIRANDSNTMAVEGPCIAGSSAAPVPTQNVLFMLDILFEGMEFVTKTLINLESSCLDIFNHS